MKSKLNLLTIAIIFAITPHVFANELSDASGYVSDVATAGEFTLGNLTKVIEMSSNNLQYYANGYEEGANVLSNRLLDVIGKSKQVGVNPNQKMVNLVQDTIGQFRGRHDKLMIEVSDLSKSANKVTKTTKIVKGAAIVADVTGRSIDVYEDYRQYGLGVATSTALLTTADGVIDYLNPYGILSAMTGLMIEDKPVTEWNLSDEFIQRAKIALEADLADFVRKPAELIKTLETEDQAHIAYLDAVDTAWRKISKDGVLGYQNRMKKLMAINDPDKFLAEAKVLQQDHMREIDGLIKGLQGFIGAMAENVNNAILHDSQNKYLAMQDRADTLNKLLNKYKAENKSVSISSDVVDAWLLKQVFQAKIDVELNDAKLFMAAAKIDAIQKTVAQPSVVDKSVLPTVLANNNQMGSSHLGTAQGYLAPGIKLSTSYADVKAYSTSSDAKIKSGTEQVALAQNTQAFDVLQDWTVTEGDQAKHFSIGDSFGSITAPDPNKPTIAALNNADVQQTTMTKVYKVPVGTKQVNVGMLANFVTNEYPEFVGSQYNDKATIEIKTGSGNIYQATLFDKELNSANFTAVSGLPSPMSGSGGQTGFEQLNKTINVANGGNLTITVKTMNVGDMAVPSATLINATSVK